MTFYNQVVVVTGAGEGLGRAIAFFFARAGATVVLAELDSEAGQDAVGEMTADAEVQRAGGKGIFVQTDVAEDGDVRAMAQQAQSLGPVRVLVNNAGISAAGTLETLPLEAWDRVLAVNLRGAFLCARHLLPAMRKTGSGAIINIASTRALMSEPDTEPYSASKGGVLALTHSLAVSLAPYRIRVNAISPGWIDTSAWKRRSRRRPSDLRPIDHAQHPAGRVGRPEDIAQACLYLASDAAGFITGANLVIDGGMTVKMIYAD